MVPENSPNHLRFSRVQESRSRSWFSDPNTSALTKAVQEGRLELARQMVNAGAKWDAFTIQRAASSLDAVRVLVECGYDLNTSLIGSGALLP